MSKFDIYKEGKYLNTRYIQYSASSKCKIVIELNLYLKKYFDGGNKTLILPSSVVFLDIRIVKVSVQIILALSRF